MNRAIEANFLPRVFEPMKEKARILIIDGNRDLTRAARLALESPELIEGIEEKFPARAES